MRCQYIVAPGSALVALPGSTITSSNTGSAVTHVIGGSASDSDTSPSVLSISPSSSSSTTAASSQLTESPTVSQPTVSSLLAAINAQVNAGSEIAVQQGATAFYVSALNLVRALQPAYVYCLPCMFLYSRPQRQ